MERSTLETIDSLIEQSVDLTENSEVRFKLRTARQLISVIEEEQETLDETVDKLVEDSDIDEEVYETLRELGYVE
ncbi:hypothetical protein [Halanaeroarchaeum sulfurireducens]|uniref:Uncharacterized protein n=1 Tax=Halanaeroarchaeum sulfurireducens TaxID=1604004 RepID=A0A0F7PBS5_9EURY|nr:hypothetical protein [Halanaeroarchaeum sulfurireducens]AKH96793.1 hypothetical protein HLASF_0286 [Halanaeroarchaeum sulfurireducens]ALG81195.1 hypothetical protein HLASA_0285 [Halanaeroarchaeum sulfurireducens]